MKKLLTRIALLLLWPVWNVMYPVILLFRELKHAWSNCTLWYSVKTEFRNSNAAFIRDLKKGRMFRTEAEKQESIQKAMDDL